MKSTGITRKIDELGRIVIPKEIRKNLNIREGESLEILTNEDYILLKKNSQIAKYDNICQKICSIINETYNINVIITDREKVIASSRKELESKFINKELQSYIDNRTFTHGEKILTIGNNKIMGNNWIFPIIDESDAIGLVILNVNSTDNYNNLGKMLVRFIIR